MRFIIVILLAFIFACNGTSPSEGSTSTAPAANTKVTKASSNFPSSPISIPKGEAPDITVTINGGPASGAVKIVGMFQGENFLLDEATIQNGVIRIKNNEPYRQGMAFVLLEDNTAIQMLITEDQTFKLTTDIKDVARNMKVEGSLDNQLLYETAKFEEKNRSETNSLKVQIDGSKSNTDELKKQMWAKIDERYAYLEKLRKDHPNQFFTKFKWAGQNPDLRDIDRLPEEMDRQLYAYHYRNKIWENVDFSDERLMSTPVISTKLKRYITELTPQHPDSIIKYGNMLTDMALPYPEYFKYFANWITLQYEPGKSKVMDAEAIHVNMIKRYFTRERAFWSDSMEVFGLQRRAYEMEASLLGKKGPDVVSKDIDGKEHSIYGMKSDYIVVYMFNPDCEHCAIETPKAVANYNGWKSKGIGIFGIAIDTDVQKLRDYINKNSIPFITTFDPTNRAIYAKYYVNVTPEVYVLNPQRKIIGKNLKIDQVMTVIDRDKNGG